MKKKNKLNQRKKMKKLLLLLLLPALMISQENIDQKIYEKALSILDHTISIDSHSDTPLRLKDSTFNISQKNTRGCFDFPRMKEGKLSAEFFAVYTANSSDNDNSFKIGIDIIQRVYSVLEKNKDIVQLATNTKEMEQIYKSKKSIICLGIENGGPLEGSLSNLKIFYNLGVRYITLTHSKNNHICDSSTDTLETWHGLSPFGKQLVSEMNKLGIMIDVSHISDNSFWDCIKYSKAPIIASHSCVRDICNSPRNLTDEMIKALAKNGGVLQLNFFPGYLSEEYNKAQADNQKQMKPIQDSLRAIYKNDSDYFREFQKLRRRNPNAKIPGIDKIVDHIDHIVKLVGIDYVGIGSDFDGLGVFPKGLEDVSKLPMITYHLLKRGYKEDDIKKIVGGNFMRVWKKVEEVAEKSK